MELLEAIIEWFSDHPQAKKDVINYVKNCHPELENDLIFSGLE